MADYISRKKVLEKSQNERIRLGYDVVSVRDIEFIPAADVVEVVRCKGCEYSTLPSEPTQRYGKPGTLTCHNRYAPCNRRNVSENDFCSYGKRRET